MDEPENRRSTNRAEHVLTALGGAGLLVAMAADGIAVLGRHAGFSFLGAIEIFQAALVVSLSCALLLASVTERHAAVDLVLGRVSARVRARLATIGKASLAVTFGLLCAGSFWVASDLWGTLEMTEILGIAVLPLRLLWIVSLAIAALYFAVSFVRGLRA